MTFVWLDSILYQHRLHNRGQIQDSLNMLNWTSFDNEDALLEQLVKDLSNELLIANKQM